MIPILDGFWQSFGAKPARVSRRLAKPEIWFLLAAPAPQSALAVS
jgi:hypothetical protein